MTTATAPQIGATAENVREIFEIRRTNYFGAKEVNATFDVETNEPVRMPNLFTDTVLERANRMGLCLVQQVDKAADRKPLTLKYIYESRKNKDFLGGKILCNSDRYKEESLFTKHTPRPGLFLKGRGVIEGTLGKTFIGESLIGAEFVEELFGKQLPEEFGKAIEDLLNQAEDLEKLCRSDWREAARQCANLRFSRFFRETPVEVVYRILIAQKVNRERLFEDVYARTNTLSQGVGLFGVGYAYSDGARLGDWIPVSADGDLGLSFSCSGEIETER
ncbi:MAG: hypothetical protein COV70_02515 [Parcubacteria group bacterium CG11_big_fil_rev_8_21_14_0_20_39_22]|nr:MAG: hypothetical protein COV70_02515 [Parcubacteria group bacterium CG11_big_fil_rev_8_21_14_0_20_39_22]